MDTVIHMYIQTDRQHPLITLQLLQYLLLQEAHEDNAGRVAIGFTPRNNSGLGTPNISGSHGQACAGIIGASQNNSIGVSGVAPNCIIVPVNIFWDGFETTIDLANAINWAWNQGQADVLSNSWGYNTSSQTQPGIS